MKWIGLSALVLVIGCGGSAPTQKPVTVGQGGSEGGASGSPGRPDLSPVAAPPELFAVGRLSNPAKIVDTVASWSKLPID